MRPLASDEKVTNVMMYTHSMLYRGDVVLRENIRASIWLRTQGVPNFIHLFNAHMIQLAGTPPKTYTKSEMFVPTSELLGFHISPPAHDPMDYDNSEANRKMEPIHVWMGSFELNAKIRISTATDFATSLDVMNTSWLSLYDAEISNPYMQQFKMMVPMLLVRPGKLGFGL